MRKIIKKLTDISARFVGNVHLNRNMDPVSIILDKLKIFIIGKYPNLQIKFMTHEEASFFSYTIYEKIIINDVDSSIRIPNMMILDLIHFLGNEEDALTELKAAFSYEIDNYLKILVA